MRKLFGYLIGLVILGGVFAMIYLASAIYDTGDKVAIQPYFFRLGLSSSDVIDTPRPLKDVQHKKLKDWLVQKYVYEYLYIEPDLNNIDNRAERYNFYSPLSYMSTKDVFENWRRTIAVDIRDMAKRGIRRTVTVFDEILYPESSDYLQVDYETKTWYKPNDMAEEPEIKRGTMYLNVDYSGAVKEPIESVQKALHDGIDPAVVFGFSVSGVIIDEK